VTVLSPFISASSYPTWQRLFEDEFPGTAIDTEKWPDWYSIDPGTYYSVNEMLLLRTKTGYAHTGGGNISKTIPMPRITRASFNSYRSGSYEPGPEHDHLFFIPGVTDPAVRDTYYGFPKSHSVELSWHYRADSIGISFKNSAGEGVGASAGVVLDYSTTLHSFAAQFDIKTGRVQVWHCGTLYVDGTLDTAYLDWLEPTMRLHPYTCDFEYSHDTAIDSLYIDALRSKNPNLSIDGDATTFASLYGGIGDLGPVYLEWDYGSLAFIRGVRVLWDNLAEYRPTGYVFEVSRDGATWTEVYSATIDPGPGWKEYVWPPMATRYVRLRIDGYGDMLEVRVYESDPVVGLSETVTLTDIPSKSLSITKTESVALTDLIAKTTSIVKTDTFVLSDIIAKTLEKLLSEAVTLTDLVTALKPLFLELVEALSLYDPRMAKSVSTVKAEAVTLTDVYSRQVSYARRFTEIAALADLVAKTPQKPLVEAITLTDLKVGKVVQKLLGELLTLEDPRITKEFAKTLAEAITLIDYVSKAPSRILAETISLTDVFGRLFYVLLDERLTLMDKLEAWKRIIPVVRALLGITPMAWTGATLAIRFKPALGVQAPWIIVKQGEKVTLRYRGSRGQSS